jgi:hypothetical protein
MKTSKSEKEVKRKDEGLRIVKEIVVRKSRVSAIIKHKDKELKERKIRKNSK